MLHPSYSELIEIVNEDASNDTPVVNSRYSIVMATSKRARQLISGDEALVSSKILKPLSVAVAELNKGKIRIITEDEAEVLKEQNRARREAEKALFVADELIDMEE